MAATAKVIELKGDKKNPESAEHIIIFPGGSISVCRTSQNQYWAHITVNKDVTEDIESQSKAGIIESIRVDSQSAPVQTIEVNENTYHFAVLIGTK